VEVGFQPSLLVEASFQLAYPTRWNLVATKTEWNRISTKRAWNPVSTKTGNAGPAQTSPLSLWSRVSNVISLVEVGFQPSLLVEASFQLAYPTRWNLVATKTKWNLISTKTGWNLISTKTEWNLVATKRAWTRISTKRA